MKRKRVLSYIRRRKYYLSLLGSLVVVAIALFIVYTGQNNSIEEIANLNEVEPEGDLVENAITDHLVENEPLVEIDKPQKEITIATEKVVGEKDPSASVPVEEEIGEGSTEDVTANEARETTEEVARDEEIKEEIVPVIKIQQPNISFDATSKLSMPLNGEVILEYNEEVPAYFQTLDQYKINKSLLIQADVGTEVKAVADGVVEKIENTKDKGFLVTVYHGNGYKSVYGQLSDDLNVQDGDVITEGKIIGYVDEPTSYYLLEGSHLYYQFLENEEPINPMEVGAQ